MSFATTLKFVLNHPLNRHRRGRALERYLRWQIGSRLLPGPVVMEWVAGTKIIVRPGETGITQNIYCGLQDFADMAYLLHVLTREDLFVDVGANVGAYTVLACAAKGARGYCFEPVPSTFARLSENLLINNLSSRVTSLNIGISDREGELSFTTGSGPMNHVVAPGDDGARSLTVPVRTLDQVLTGESPSLLKIDVEGFETPVTKGATATLFNPSLHSILIELNGSGSNYGFDEQAIIDMLSKFGFGPCEYDPFRRELIPMSGKNETGNNTLFVRNPAAIRERLQQAPLLSIHSVEF